MNLLLDTHSFLWFVSASTRLTPTAKAAIEDPNNQKWVSIVSCWEISIKFGLGKLSLSDAVDVFLSQQLATNHFSVLPIELSHVCLVSRLPLHHRDPFDRLLIAQAQIESLGVVGCDHAFDPYGIQRIW